jgi:hypothetical protein
MVQQTLNPPPVTSPFTTGDSSEKGDTPNALVIKLQAMMNELYSKALAGAKYVTSAVAGPATAAAGDLTGALTVNAIYSNIGANNLTTRTAAQMIADAGLVVGQSYELGIGNTNAGTLTLVGGTGVTISGTATIALNVLRWYVVTVTGAAAITIQNTGSGTTP